MYIYIHMYTYVCVYIIHFICIHMYPYLHTQIHSICMYTYNMFGGVATFDDGWDMGAGHAGTPHQPSSRSQIFFLVLCDVHWGSPESGDLWYKSRGAKNVICSPDAAFGDGLDVQAVQVGSTPLPGKLGTYQTARTRFRSRASRDPSCGPLDQK